VVVTGDIDSPGQLHIDGKVTGDVSCGTLCQGESGAIAGNIAAEDARLAGLVDGAVSAGTLLLEPTARITGDVLYGTLTVATGAQVDGRFKHRDGSADGSLKARTADLPGPARPAQPVLVQPSGLFAGAAAEAAE
jgi:cytoskeletal protein CcmA (bactofilin family)